MKAAQLQPEIQFEVSFLAARQSVAAGALRWLHILGDLLKTSLEMVVSL